MRQVLELIDLETEYFNDTIKNLSTTQANEYFSLVPQPYILPNTPKTNEILEKSQDNIILRKGTNWQIVLLNKDSYHELHTIHQYPIFKPGDSTITINNFK